MSRRARRPLLAGALVVGLILFVPWTRRSISSQAPLEPSLRVRVEAREDSTVEAVLAHESDAVAAGQALYRLHSDSNEADLARLGAERQRFVRSGEVAREASLPKGVFESDRLGAAVEAGYRDARERQERLVVRSPTAGRVLTARTDDLAGQFVRGGTALAEIGDCRKMIAQFPVSERLLNDLSLGARVRGLLSQRPLRPLEGRIIRISPATENQPRTVSGGDEPIAPSLRPDRFLAVAEFDNPDGELRSGAVVRAKIYSARASLGARGTRVLSRWLQTVFW